MISAKANIAGVRKKFAAFKKGVRMSAPEVLESEGRIVAVSLAKSTQPFGTGAEAKDEGERAVSRDIAKVYRTMGDVFSKLPISGMGDAKQFWKLIKLGRTDAAQKILAQAGTRSFQGVAIGSFDDGALHQKARDSRGRVSQKSPSLIVLNSSALLAYAKTKVNRVGYGKSGWATAARQLGGTRGLRGPKLAGGERDITAVWITRHRAPGAVLRRYGDGSRPLLTLRSEVPYGARILSQTAMNNAVRIARGRIMKQIEMAARYEMRQARAA